MRKISKILLIIAIILIAFQIKVYAAGSISPSTRSLTITEGSSGSFSINASNAAGRVNISSSNSAVASVSTSSVWVENSSSKITVTGNSAGSATITVSLYDAATFDEEVLSGSYSINVTVKPKQQETTNNNQGSSTPPTNQGSSTPPTNNNTSSSNKPQNNLSKNNEIGTLSVEGYELVDKGNRTYELTVNNTITKINIIGTAKDSKAKISGTGTKELKTGENVFTITVTAESGAKKEYTVKIIRKNNISLDDLKDVLPTFNENIVEVVLDEKDTNIAQDVLGLIKENKKNVSFSKYDKNGQLLYSWGINGAKIKELNEFNTIINYNNNEKIIEKIKNVTNYTDGLYIDFEHSGTLPEGTNIKINIDNKFKNGKLVNIYFYNEESNKLENIEKGLEVKDGYIEFEIKHCSTYFATEANLSQNASTSKADNKIIAVIAIIEFVIIIVLGYICYRKK